MKISFEGFDIFLFLIVRITVAAANKHTAVISDSGEGFTWGCKPSTKKQVSHYGFRRGKLSIRKDNVENKSVPNLKSLYEKVAADDIGAKKHVTVFSIDIDCQQQNPYLFKDTAQKTVSNVYHDTMIFITPKIDMWVS
ncbi:hypothetical protein L1987_84247 [Smallanthus sonchifolius]|uniref:Uncharacterized protein n=1 Tax=Smallanthus sonchifolius TaxID=185202 RepID=A0ACB8YEU1_9ASTR|nr:hypothetical protein L1987_84247 [Smallanthus sonchifolius]